MAPLNGGHPHKHEGQLLQPLLPGLPGELGVHPGPLVALPLGRLFQTLLRVPRRPKQLFIPEPGVHHLVFRHPLKGGGHLLVPIAPGSLGEVAVLVPGDGFARQGCLKVFRGFCAC